MEKIHKEPSQKFAEAHERNKNNVGRDPSLPPKIEHTFTIQAVHYSLYVTLCTFVKPALRRSVRTMYTSLGQQSRAIESMERQVQVGLPKEVYFLVRFD